MANFAGKYNATIDDKGRVVLPSAFKKAMGEMGFDHIVLERNRRSKCLDLHTEENWAKDVEKFKERLTADTSQIHDKILTLYFDNFIRVPLAANGRINIPNDFLEYAGLQDKVSFLGMHTSIRLSAASAAEKLTVSDEDYLEMLKMIGG